MAKIAPETWDAIKADYATGRFNSRQLGEKYGVSHTGINKRAAAEGWTTLDPESVNSYIKTQAELAEVKGEIIEVSKSLQIDECKLTGALDDLTAFEIESNRIMARIDAKALEMLDYVDKPNDVKAIMDVHQKHREARMGKSPDTAIQINNSNTAPPSLQVVFNGNSH